MEFDSSIIAGPASEAARIAAISIQTVVDSSPEGPRRFRLGISAAPQPASLSDDGDAVTHASRIAAQLAWYMEHAQGAR